VRVASPLALYQIRAGIAAQGSFGPLSAAQQASLHKLRETFFPHRTERQLVPYTEPLRVPRVPIGDPFKKLDELRP
jgi:hypothetical protein